MPDAEPMLKGFVYLYHAVGTPFYKIGYTYDPIRRRSEVQSDCPYKVNSILCIPSLNPGRIEVFFHNRFSSRRSNGGNEWFELTEADIKDFVSLALEINHLPPSAKLPKYPAVEPEKRRFTTEELKKGVEGFKERIAEEQKKLEVVETALFDSLLRDYLIGVGDGTLTDEDVKAFAEEVKKRINREWKDEYLENLMAYAEAGRILRREEELK